MDILALIKYCVSTVASAIFLPQNNMIFVMLLFIIYSQYKRNAAFQEYAYGQIKTPISKMMITSTLSGLAAGIIISLLMTFLGITFSNDMGIVLLIPISIFLMLFDLRFLCFSYSGGLLSIICLIFGIKGVDVTGILELVAILHMLESLLILIDGSEGAVPISYRNRDGSLTGGFSMQRMWPIPAAIVVLTGFGVPTGDSINMPNWWPIIKPYMDPSQAAQAIFAISSFTAVLGYSEFATSCLPKEKAKDSALKLGLFSIVLLLLSIVSSRIYIFKFIAALFAPAAHEYLIQRGKKAESSKKSIFLPVNDGIKVLDTLPGGPAEAMNIAPGDTVLSINNRQVISKEGLDSFFTQYVNYIWLDVRDRLGNIRTIEYKNYREGIEDLGILPVPKNDNTDSVIVMVSQEGILVRLFKKIIKGFVH